MKKAPLAPYSESICCKVAERMGFETAFYRLSHVIYGLKPTLRLLAAATVVMVISAQKT